jgi:hypothetical protein
VSGPAHKVGNEIGQDEAISEPISTELFLGGIENFADLAVSPDLFVGMSDAIGRLDPMPVMSRVD